MSQRPADSERSLLSRLLPIAVTKTAGNFNDNAFKMVVTFVAVADEPDLGRKNAIIAIGSMLFMLPYLIFPTVSGWVGDRFNKKNVLIGGKVAELVVMIYATVGFIMLPQWGWLPLLLGVFFMAMQSTFFTPAFLGILPEMFDERDLPNVNGILELFGFLGIILGTGSAIIYNWVPQQYAWLLGAYFIVLSVIGLLAAIKVRNTDSPRSGQAPGIHFVTEYFSNLRYTWQTQEIFLCILGHAVVMSVGMLLLTSLVSFAKDDLGFANSWVSILQVGGAVGIGLGSFLAGKLSDHKAEFGLVPIGASMLTFFLILINFSPRLPPPEVLHHVGPLAAAFPKSGGDPFVFGFPHIYATVSITLTGLGAGIFSLPFLVYLQDRTPREVRGKTMATMNALTFLAMFLVSLAMFVLTGGTGEPLANPDWVDQLRASCFQFSMRDLYLYAAITLVLTTGFAYYWLPDFLCRFVVVIITRTVYRMRVMNRDHVPHEGAALLLANHVTFVDGFLIGAATSRYVHFVVDARFADHWLVRPFRKWAGIVRMPTDRAPGAMIGTVKEVHALLRRGEVVCVFPEGRQTRNGALGEFKRGFQLMVPKGLNVPLIPVNLGLMWGSVFSRRQRRTWRVRMPRPVTVAFGEPLTRHASAYEVRQAVALLASDALVEPSYGESTLADYFLRLAARRRRAPLLCDSGGAWQSAAQVSAKALALSRLIARQPGAHIGVILPPCSQASIVGLGCYLANKVPVYLNFTASAEAQQSAIERAEIAVILTSRRFIEKAGILEQAGFLYLEDLVGEITGKERAYAAAGVIAPRLLRRLQPKRCGVRDSATVLFSSGSTGEPKGVELSHHNLNTNAFTVAQVVNLGQDDIMLGALPMFHSFGFLATFWLPLTHGVRVAYHANPRDAVAIGEAVQKVGATILFATPTILQLYIRKCTPEQFGSLRLVITGAEKLRPAVAEAFANKFGVMPIEGFGATELSPVVSVNMPHDVVDLGKQNGKPGSVGQAMHGVSVRTLDPSGMTVLGPGEEGILQVRGPNVMNGYLKDPERTAEVLDDGWYNTGDLATIDDEGFIFITGRLSRFSKIAGEMIPHGALEEEIHEILGADHGQMAVVTGVSDDARGERLVVLHLAMEHPADHLIQELRKRKLPNLWIPKAADFHLIDAIPVLGTGKLDLRTIRELAYILTHGDRS